MKIKINNTEYELNFGIRFVRELDKVASVSNNGISLGMALMRTLPALQTCDPVALCNVIYAAAYGNNPRPSMKDVERFIDKEVSFEELEKYFDDILKEINESTATKLVAKNLKA
jgi:hypothetical protein